MIELSGFPSPDNAPEPGACIRIERPESGLAVIVLDPPHRKMPVFDAPLLRDLDLALDEIEADKTLKGVVITGREPLVFAAGADIDAIKSLTDPEIVKGVVLAAHSIFMRIENLKPYTVAAVGGPVPGGACEITFCCNRTVLVDDPKTRIGLPETQLGILPGWGGTHRLPERIGVPMALDAILTGKLFVPKVAKKRGIVDRITKPEYLVQVASDIAMRRMKCTRKTRGMKAWLVDRNPLLLNIIASQAKKAVLSKTKGFYPAPIRALELAVRAVGRSRKRMVELEAQAIADLATSTVCKSLIGIFHASETAKKLGKGTDDFTPRKFARAGVIGAGIMGGGIASLMAGKGIQTRMADLDGQAVATAVGLHRKSVDKKVKKRRLTRAQGIAAIDHLDGTTSTTDFGSAQVVIEAVAEVLEIKQKVLGGLAAQMADDAILATNTSSLSVAAIADGIPHPERVVGMHFFNPVKAMPLVEVIQGENTSREAALEVAALARGYWFAYCVSRRS